jgi:hypothetical protein
MSKIISIPSPTNHLYISKLEHSSSTNVSKEENQLDSADLAEDIGVNVQESSDDISLQDIRLSEDWFRSCDMIDDEMDVETHVEMKDCSRVQQISVVAQNHIYDNLQIQSIQNHSDSVDTVLLEEGLTTTNSTVNAQQRVISFSPFQVISELHLDNDDYILLERISNCLQHVTVLNFVQLLSMIEPNIFINCTPVHSGTDNQMRSICMPNAVLADVCINVQTIANPLHQQKFSKFCSLCMTLPPDWVKHCHICKYVYLHQFFDVDCAHVHCISSLIFCAFFFCHACLEELECKCHMLRFY